MSIDYTDMAFPKYTKKRKRKRHPKSILQPREDKRCYLCMLLENDHRQQYTHEHHVVFGSGRKAKSEHFGLKVNLCPKHHSTKKEGVHGNKKLENMLVEIAQKAFKVSYPKEKWEDHFTQ